MWCPGPHKPLIWIGIFIIIIGFIQAGSFVSMNKGKQKGGFVNTKQKGGFVNTKQKGGFVSTKQKGGFVNTSSKKGSFISSTKKNAYKPPSQKQTLNAKVYSCPSKSVTMNCLSCATRIFRKCSVPSATKITKARTCPSESIEMNCMSCKQRIFRTCHVPSSTKITKIYVMDEYANSKGHCNVGYHENFGISDRTNIWVDLGCRAKFIICYETAPREPKNVPCSSKRRNRSTKCPLGLKGSDILIKVSLLFSNRNCKEHKTWGYDDRKIWVKGNCTDTFRVDWS